MRGMGLISTAVLLSACGVTESTSFGPGQSGGDTLKFGEVVNGCLQISQSEWKKIPWLNAGKKKDRSRMKDEFAIDGVAVEAKGKRTRKRIMQRNGNMHVVADAGTVVGIRDENKKKVYVKVIENASLIWDGETIKCKAA